MKRLCKQCGEEKDIHYFGKLKNGKDGIHIYCKECNSKRCKEYRSDSKHKARTKLLQMAWRIDNKEKWEMYCKLRRDTLKLIALQAYSKEKPECACCKEDHIEFLTIDHIDGNGSQHRRKINKKGGQSFYLWLQKSGFPSGYRVLCYNCNCSIGARGYCPHNNS